MSFRCAFAIPGDLSTPTGGYVYARKVLPLLAKSIDISACPLPGGFPFPSAADLDATRAALEAADGADTVFFFDGLAYGATPTGIISSLRAPLVVLVHHPLCLEEGLNANDRQRLERSESEALALARHIVVPSEGTAKALRDLFGIGPSKVTIASPGIMRGERARGSASPPLHIVSVGTITPRKGFEVLAAALNELRDLDWRATIAGSLDRSPATTAALVAAIRNHGLSDRINFAGVLDEPELSALYASGDIFALASFYEGYGMAFAEAMAHGLPVVASGDGAVRDTVPQSAGFVYPPGDAGAIADGLRRLLTDAGLRKQMSEAAWQHGKTLPRWEETARIIAEVLKRAHS